MKVFRLFFETGDFREGEFGDALYSEECENQQRNGIGGYLGIVEARIIKRNGIERGGKVKKKRFKIVGDGNDDLFQGQRKRLFQDVFFVTFGPNVLVTDGRSFFDFE